jgi:hypothetical protein
VPAKVTHFVDWLKAQMPEHWWMLPLEQGLPALAAAESACAD